MKLSKIILMLFAFIPMALHAQNRVVVVPLGDSSLSAAATVIATGYIAFNGNIRGGFGISDVTYDEVEPGEYEIELSTPATNKVAIATSFSSSPDDEIISVTATGTNIKVNIVDASTSAAKDSAFYVVVYGIPGAPSAKELNSAQALDVDGNKASKTAE